MIATDFNGKILREKSTAISSKQSRNDAEELALDTLARETRVGLKPQGTDWLIQKVTCSPIPYAEMAKKHFMIPVYLDNEANTSALDYFTYSDRSKPRNQAYLSIGMAAGLMLKDAFFMKIKTDGAACLVLDSIMNDPVPLVR